MSPYAKEIIAVVIFKLILILFLWWICFSSVNQSHFSSDFKQHFLAQNNN